MVLYPDGNTNRRYRYRPRSVAVDRAVRMRIPYNAGQNGSARPRHPRGPAVSRLLRRQSFDRTPAADPRVRRHFCRFLLPQARTVETHPQASAMGACRDCNRLISRNADS